MSELSERLRKEFKDGEYRHSYAESFLNTTLAAQIEVLREQRGWSQQELAQKAGMKQSAISRLEDVDYSRWTVTTLRKLAKAFDVALIIRFEGFGEMVRQMALSSRVGLERPSFESDVFYDPASAETPPTTFQAVQPSFDSLVLNWSASPTEEMSVVNVSDQRPSQYLWLAGLT